jgi:serine/threonine-protein kinase
LVWAYRQQLLITRPTEAGPKAKAAALKAVSFDDNAAEAHLALADIMTWTDWDWAGAEREWKRTIELNPNLPDARAFYSHYLNIMRRPDEAMTQIQRALELDPFNVIIQGFYAMDLVFVRRYDDAITLARRVLQTAPDAPLVQSALYQALFDKQMYSEALALDKQLFAGDPEYIKAFERGYAESGYPGSQKRGAEVYAAREGAIDPLGVANGYVYAGEKDRALEWLEKAYEQRHPGLPYLGAPMYDGLRSDPRFQSILRRMRLPQ